MARLMISLASLSAGHPGAAQREITQLTPWFLGRFPPGRLSDRLAELRLPARQQPPSRMRAALLSPCHPAPGSPPAPPSPPGRYPLPPRRVEIRPPHRAGKDTTSRHRADEGSSSSTAIYRTGRRSCQPYLSRTAVVPLAMTFLHPSRRRPGRTVTAVREMGMTDCCEARLASRPEGNILAAARPAAVRKKLPAVRTCPACRTAQPYRPGDPLPRRGRSLRPGHGTLTANRTATAGRARSAGQHPCRPGTGGLRAATGLSQTDVGAMAGWRGRARQLPVGRR
jgi:hypothetical protein